MANPAIDFTLNCGKALLSWGGRFLKSAKNGGKIVDGVRSQEGTVHWLGRGAYRFGTSKIGGWGLTIGGLYGWGKYSDKGVLDAAGNVAETILLDKDNRGKGLLVGGVRQALDTATGDGSADKVVEKADQALEALGNGKDAAVRFALNMKEKGSELFRVNPAEMPQMYQYADRQMQQYYDPNALRYADQNPYQQDRGFSLSDFSPFTGFRNLLNHVTGGNTNLMSVAAMIPAAMLMFGNFGWMGKIASLMLGSMAVKNLNHPAQTYAPNPQIQVQPQQAQQLFERNFQMAMEDGRPNPGNDDNQVIMRGRG